MNNVTRSPAVAEKADRTASDALTIIITLITKFSRILSNVSKMVTWSESEVYGYTKEAKFLTFGDGKFGKIGWFGGLKVVQSCC